MFFRIRMQSIDRIEKVRLEKAVMPQYGKMQAVTTLCDVSEVCAPPSATVIVVCQVLCAKVVGATSSEGFQPHGANKVIMQTFFYYRT